MAGELAERVLTSLPEDRSSPSQGLSQSPHFPTGVSCPGLVGAAVLADTWITGTWHWDCWDMAPGLLGYGTGIAGVLY